MKYKVYLKSGTVAEINSVIPYIENDSRIFFCESDEQAEKLILSEYKAVVGSLISYFEKSEIIGIDFPKVKDSSVNSPQRPVRQKRIDKYGNF
jgi:hypothetical protein